jgi:hypothetical protein
MAEVGSQREVGRGVKQEGEEEREPRPLSLGKIIGQVCCVWRES